MRINKEKIKNKIKKDHKSSFYEVTDEELFAKIPIAQKLNWIDSNQATTGRGLLVYATMCDLLEKDSLLGGPKTKIKTTVDDVHRLFSLKLIVFSQKDKSFRLGSNGAGFLEIIIRGLSKRNCPWEDLDTRL